VSLLFNTSAVKAYHHYYIYNSHTYKVHRYRAADFRIYDSQQDPVTHYYHPQLKAITTKTPVYALPITRSIAQQAPDAAEWATAWNKELGNLETRGTLQFIPLKNLPPPNMKLLPTTTVLRIKYDAQGQPYNRKARCNVRGDWQQPHIQYNPHQ